MLTTRHWNALIVLTLIFGTVYIALTRAAPAVLPPSPVIEEPTSNLPAGEPAPEAGHPAPDFTLEALDGGDISLSALRGQVVLVNMWATWCPPCRSEMPAIQSTYDRYHERGFTVVAVNQQEDAATVAAYFQENGLTFPAVLDRTASTAASYQVRVLPSSFFVDKHGTVRVVYRGPLPQGILDGTVEELLKE
jgi:peroxiredoxin